MCASAPACDPEPSGAGPERFFGELQARLRDARSARLRRCEQFFDGLAPRLDMARTLERELDSRLARRFNAFGYLRTDELGLSRIVGDLLDPRGKHGQGTLFLKTLLDGLQGFDAPGDLSRARVALEETIDDDRRLDVHVDIDERHGLAIENKPWAVDGKDQIRDYLGWLKGRHERFILIYLSPQGEPPDGDSVGVVDLERLEARQVFGILPYCDSETREDEFDDFRMDYSLVRWMADCRIRCDVDKLRWFLREAETWCERTFGVHAMTIAETETISEFVRSGKRNMETALAVYETWPRISAQICSDALQIIVDNLRKESAFSDGLEIDARYDEHERQYRIYISIYRARWKTYGSGPRRMNVRLENQVKGPESWVLGVHSGIAASELTGRARKRRERLDHEVQSLNFGKRSNYWPCWKYVDEKYRRWGPLVPSLWEECNDGGGEITRYFVGALRDIAETVVPIVDDIDGA